MLGCHVAAHPADTRQPRLRRHVHDRPTASFEHGRDLVLHREEDAREAHAQRPVEVREVEVRKGCRHVSGAGVVEGDVQTAERRQRGANECLHRCGIADVGGDDQCFSARLLDLCGHAREGVAVPGGEHYGRSGLPEYTGGCGTDAPARAGDDRHLSVQQPIHARQSRVVRLRRSVRGQGRPGIGGAPGVPAMKLMWMLARRHAADCCTSSRVARRSRGTSPPR